MVKPRGHRRSTVLLVAIAGLASCDFAIKHPATTAAIAGGTLGFGTCQLEVGKPGTCAVVGGSTAAFLGLVAGLAMWTMGGDGDEHVLYDPPDEAVRGGAEATDGSPDGTQVDDPQPAIDVNATPRGSVVPRARQTPIPRLVDPAAPAAPPPDAGVPSDAASP
ncbi:MAG: hypothetical protein NT062_02195 [Proteobacteria bacterium]|nr:hypothetical protein [Pseudomonadota bacterium]